jgi:DNA uptake protein ComE-like DNA-binding protein
MPLLPAAPDPYQRFQSIAELTRAADRGIRISVHSATVDDWLRLPGLSIHQAKALVNLQRAGLALYSIADLAAALEVPLHRIQGWQAILSFEYHAPESLSLQANPNQASREELEQIPAIDSDLAAAIIQERKVSPYKDLSDFQQRLQLNGTLLGELLHYLRFKPS